MTWIKFRQALRRCLKFMKIFFYNQKKGIQNPLYIKINHYLCPDFETI